MANLANGEFQTSKSSKLNRVAGAYRLNRVQACFLLSDKVTCNKYYVFNWYKKIGFFTGSEFKEVASVLLWVKVIIKGEKSSPLP